jgi:hypothetical protein
MQITESERLDMISTARSKGAVGKNALLPGFVASIPALKKHLILDFGCGKDAVHVTMLRNKGYEFVYGCDLSPISNQNYVHPDEKAIPWHLVYASNVLNVQPSFTALNCTICKIADFARYGVAYMSYPKSPRPLRIDIEEMRSILSPYFKTVHSFKYKSTTIFKCAGKNCELLLEEGLTVIS